MSKPDSSLPFPTVSEILVMPLAEFEQRFGFRPEAAIEKFYYATIFVRMDEYAWYMYRAGLMAHPDLSTVVME